jgi:hypothetical protein
MCFVGVAAAPACASKKFVRTEVGNVNSKVDTLNTSLEETQQRTSRNEERIASVDGKAEAAGKSAQDARAAADAADQVGHPGEHPRRPGQHGPQGDQREIAASRKLLYEVTLNEDQGNFKFGHADLPDAAKGASRPGGRPAEGRAEERLHRDRRHTDNQGDALANQKLGLERAEVGDAVSLRAAPCAAAQDETSSSYARETKPIAPKQQPRTAARRNRRVVVTVPS